MSKEMDTSRAVHVPTVALASVRNTDGGLNGLELHTRVKAHSRALARTSTAIGVSRPPTASLSARLYHSHRGQRHGVASSKKDGSLSRLEVTA